MRVLSRYSEFALLRVFYEIGINRDTEIMQYPLIKS